MGRRNQSESTPPRTRPTTPPERPPFTDYFSGHAALYARARPTYPEQLIGEVAALAPTRRVAWDAGTGSGQAARQLARHFEHVRATDGSAKQIAEAPSDARVAFAVELAERCTLPDSSCDLVLAANSLHWFDHDRFFAEVSRVLRPGGLLAAIGYGWFYVEPAVDEIVGRTMLKPLQSMWAAANRLLIDGYRSLEFPGTEVRLTPCALHLSWTREQLEDYVRSWSAVQRSGPGLVEAASAELATIWADEEPRHVFMPVITRAARL